MADKMDKSTKMTDKNSPEPAPEAKASTQPVKTRRRWNMGNLFWGLLLILIGALFLLDNFGVVDVSFGNILRLWPLLIIAAGVSILSIRGWIGALITAILMILMLGLVALSAIGFAPNANTSSRTTSAEVASIDNVRDATISIENGAGRIDLTSNPEQQLLNAELHSDFAELKQKSVRENDTQEVTLTVDADGQWWRGNYRNDLSVELTEQLPLSLRVKAGATQVNADLSQVTLRELEIDGGASDIDLKLGQKLDLTNVSLDIGVSSLRLTLPKDAGVRLDVESGLSGRDTEGLREVGEGSFESANYASAKHKIIITGRMGVSNLEISYY